MRTVFRFKPTNKPITGDPSQLSLEVDAESNTAIVNKPNKQQIEFTCNSLFDTNSTQSIIFKNVGQRLIDNALEGYNTSVFAYGQTGSGKTYTMFGDDKNEGLSYRCLRYLFHSLRSNAALQSSTVTVSAVEIYNDKIYDRLLQTEEKNLIALTLNNDKISNLSSLTVESFEDTKKHLEHAIATRMTASTKMNNQSSRSHLVISFDLHQEMKSGVRLESKLHFIDLAGSERVKKTKATGNRLNEAKSINSSLLALGRVVDALIAREKKSVKTHIPYRDCTLTRLLKHSLGGNSMTTIIGCCSVDTDNLDETVSTLHFIARSREIRNKPIINQRYDRAQLSVMQKKFDLYRLEAEKIIEMQKEEFMAVIDKLKKENLSLRQKLKNDEKDNERNQKKLNDEIEEFKNKIKTHETLLNEYKNELVDISKLGNKFRKVMFLEAIQNGQDLNTIQKMLEHVDINCTDSNGEGALAFAVKANNVKLMKFLLMSGADVNIFDNDSISALMVAVVYRRQKMVKLLLRFGADVDYQNSLGCTAIHIAASRGFTDIVDRLLVHTKDVNKQSKRGWTALMFAAKAGHVEIICSLLSMQNIDINAVNKANCSALILAAYSGREDVVSILMSNGADYSIRDKFGMTAHIWAEKKKYQIIMDLMSAHGSKLSLRDKFQIML